MKDLNSHRLDEDDLIQINGGVNTSNEDRLRRVKCKCGEVFMANIDNPEIECPVCHRDCSPKKVTASDYTNNVAARTAARNVTNTRAV